MPSKTSPATTPTAERTQKRKRLVSLLNGTITPQTIKKTPKTTKKANTKAKRDYEDEINLDPPKYLVSKTRKSEEHSVDARTAELWLRCAARNRKLDSRDVAKYAEIMKRGDWQANHPQGLVFDQRGRLIEGQHRLAAVMKAAETEGENFSVDFTVMLGYPTESQEVIDTGRPRTMAQTARITGLDATAAEIAVCKALWISPDPQRAKIPRITDRQKVFAVITRFKEGIELASRRHSGRNSVGLASIRSVIARAYYYCDGQEEIDRLERFLEVLDTGLAKDESEHHAVYLRNAYTAVNVMRTSAQLDLYRKAIYAVSTYMDRKPIKRLKQEKTQLFPLDGFEGDEET